MTWLEWVGAVSRGGLMPLGVAVLAMLFAQWWAEKKHVRKVLLNYYILKLQRESRKRRGP